MLGAHTSQFFKPGGSILYLVHRSTGADPGDHLGSIFLRPRCEGLSEGFPRRARDKYLRFVAFPGFWGHHFQLGNMFFVPSLGFQA